MKNNNLIKIWKNDSGYLLIIVTMLGMLLAIILGKILPQLQFQTQTKAINSLNEYRAYETAASCIESIETSGITSTTIDDLTINIEHAVNQICTKDSFFQYNDSEGNLLYTSGTQGLTATTTGDSEKLDIVIIAANSSNHSLTCYYYNYDEMAETGNFITVSPDPFFLTSGVMYYDYDKQPGMRFSSTIDFDSDFKFDYNGGDWLISVGMDGTWRSQTGSEELWHINLNSIANLHALVFVRSRAIIVPENALIAPPFPQNIEVAFHWESGRFEKLFYRKPQ